MKIGVLTSSRADYGIYFPLLKAIQRDKYFDLNLLVFGAHLSEKFGKTIKHIEADGFPISNSVKTMPNGDTPGDISQSMARTISEFITIWDNSHFDLLLALGDRYEMFAAVASSVPYNIPVAHLHGGETTLGAIDNSFRHAITCLSSIHFTSTDTYKDRVFEITGKKGKVFNTGALSIDMIKQSRLLTIEEMKQKYNIDLSKPTILITFHPETINPDQNKKHINELLKALDCLSEYQMVITMPNADTAGLHVRKKITTWSVGKKNAHIVESFGSVGYLTCMKHCTFLLGNTSSGFVEASYFSKPVINLGDRQKGRILTPNILNCGIEKTKILNSIKAIEQLPIIEPSYIYGDGTASDKIIKLLKSL
jgi:GDP/UDP-N,N'-diacetylbacillosamine 2-epimerase (hydrolysing)